jgi:DNA repair photolyase
MLNQIIDHVVESQTDIDDNEQKSPTGCSAHYGTWKSPLVISPSNFQHKSLCVAACNPVLGCSHGCLFCYVPDTSTNKQAKSLLEYGVKDPDREWGNYAFFRLLKKHAFLKSLKQLEAMPIDQLNKDGNRAVMFSTTTDPYQTSRHEDLSIRKVQNRQLQSAVRQSLEYIRDLSSLNVRILTRSPLARLDFELFKSFGERLVFGMSLPTLDNELAKIYEPYAPSPSKRLETLQAAKKAGINIYVAIAPTYPECTDEDIRKTLVAVKALEPVTIFHEPVNIRADNVKRIEEHANSLGKSLNTAVFATPNAWRRYAIESLMRVQQIAGEVGVLDRLHLWPDSDLDSKAKFLEIRKDLWRQLYPDSTPDKNELDARKQQDIAAFETLHAWIQGWWSRISEWPGQPKQADWEVPSLPPSSLFVPKM